jgi:hypothetical protein
MPHSNFCEISFCSAWQAPVFRCSQNSSILYLIPLWRFGIIFRQFSVSGSGENISIGGAELFFLDHKEKLVVPKRVCLHSASPTIYEFRLLCTIHEVSSAAYTNITSKTMRKAEGPGLSELKTVRDKFPASDTTPHEFSV